MSSSTSSESKALVRKAEKADMALMPPPPTKRIRRPATVLDEDTYTTALSSIIMRDFFPGLLETQHQQEYLDALESRDSEWIEAASRKLTEVMTTPQRRRRGTGFSTPRMQTPMREVANPMAPKDETPGVDTNMSLDRFQTKYTSEDNESFNSLLDTQNEKRRKAYAFLWNGNKVPGFRGKAALALKAREEEEEEEEEKKQQQLLLENGESGERKTIMEADTRPPVPNTWQAEPRNGLMFTPDNDMPPPPLPPSTKDLPPKAVVHVNTRLPPVQPEVPPSPSTSLVDAAIAGRPLPPSSSAGPFTAAETPRVNGYSFVADAPSPSPSELGTPPLTWGSVAGLNSTDRASTPSPFKIAATPKRELLHHRMVERVAKSKRKEMSGVRAGTPGASPAVRKTTTLGGGREVPSFKSAATLTPAGERLLKGLTARRETGLREALRRDTGEVKGAGGRGFRWTPTPMVGKR